ncbi:hypothetical protein VKT23_020064 [Stygiomarasmius scandens]|uniref:Uncharacterized protein n=1 Tax=Marasmiellus scandens TaxID=2682957 RepID=A0ABR1INU2_9AGAR
MTRTSASQKARNHLVRKLILHAFGVDAIKDVPKQTPVTAERLALFSQHPDVHGPKLDSVALDVSAPTASEMRSLPWNKELIRKMALKAFEMSRQPEYATALDEDVDWARILDDRLYRVLLEVQLARDSQEPLHGLDERYKLKKEKAKLRRCLQEKFDRRQQTCSAMMDFAHKQGDVKDLAFWASLLTCTEVLTVNGMSDEEDGIDAGEVIKLVSELDFRHPDFHPIFSLIDSTRESEDEIFTSVGRKRMRRIYTGVTNSDRIPPENLPPSYYRPEYLQHMLLSHDSSVKLAEGNRANLLIPKLK